MIGRRNARRIYPVRLGSTAAMGLFERDARVIADIERLRFFPLEVMGGEGSFLIAEDGRRLLDLSATWGAASLGYGHPAVVEAVTAATRSMAGAGILSAVSEPAVALAEELLRIVPREGERRVWLGHSGSDANEAAVRAIIAATGRSRVLSFVGAYHGGTAGSMAVSGHTAQEGVEKLSRARAAPVSGSATGRRPEATPARWSCRGWTSSSRRRRPPEDVAALFVEPIQSDGGMVVPAPGVLRELQDRCRRHGILVVCDEVKVGLGRAGILHAFQAEGLDAGRGDVRQGPGRRAAGVGGDRAGCGDGRRACLRHPDDGGEPGLGERRTRRPADDRGGGPARRAQAWRARRLIRGLRRVAESHPLIGEVRGRGLAIGVDLVRDRDSREPATAEAARVVYRAFELGLVAYYVGMHSNVLELTPSLLLSDAEIDQALDVLDHAIGDVEEGRVPEDIASRFAGW